MRRTSLSVAAACVLVVAAAFSLARARDPREAAFNAAPAWEYRVLMLSDVVTAQQAQRQELAKTGAAVESKFNELGRDGWELGEYINGMVVFKRPKP